MRSLVLGCCFILGVLAPAQACPRAELDDVLGTIDEHVFWAEFWDDVDAGEAQRERGYALSGVDQLIALAHEPDCAGDPVVANFERLARSMQQARSH